MAEPSILGALRDPQFRSDTLRNLVEALNGAKRSLTVGSLGAVGDMGSTLANLVRAGAGTAYHEATGRPIPQALEYRDPARDFGTSASLGNFAESQGWLPPQTFSMPEQAGALLGPIVAMKAPDLAQSTLRGLVSALKSEPSRRMVEGYMGGMGMKPQAIVYHGSPHQFDAFDSSKIGTGEGAQAYGHGLYLAERPTVATSYKKGLTEKDFIRKVRDTYGEFDSPRDAALSLAKNKELNKEQRRLLSALRKDDNLGFDYPHQAVQAALREPDNFDMSPRTVAALDNLGSLYKVDLPDPLIARMLDWDKPLSQQAPEVRGLLRKHGISGRLWEVQAVGDGPQGYLNDRFIYDSAIDARKQITELRNQGYYARPFIDGMGKGKTGAEFVRDLNDPAQQSERLRAMGIPGIRYLDGGSRADGAGTSNFVVFPGEESALTILERNGKPVPLRDLLKGPAEATETRLNAVTKPEYGIDHRPMTVEGGASQLHDLTPSFGDDIYGPNALQFFGSGDPREKSVVGLLKKIRGNPDALVTIYRGVPDGAPQTINPGDWITLDKNAASDYGRVVEMKVPASHVTSWSDSLLEFGYYPPGKKP